jgi:hypothetical protein
MHHDVQEKMYVEIKTICDGRPPLLTDIPNLVYILCVMYETIRLFPVTGFLPRRTLKDELLLGKHHIPKNTSIGADLVNLHRNETYWGNNCNEFDPSRFDNRNRSRETEKNWHVTADGKIKFPVRGAFTPFGEGARVCLGNRRPRVPRVNSVGRRFAEVEFITFLAMVVERWTIHLGDGWAKEDARSVLDASVQYTTIKPPSNIPIVLKKR